MTERPNSRQTSRAREGVGGCPARKRVLTGCILCGPPRRQQRVESCCHAAAVYSSIEVAAHKVSDERGEWFYVEYLYSFDRHSSTSARFCSAKVALVRGERDLVLCLALIAAGLLASLPEAAGCDL
eukprot:349652-Pleurochrysis_carterae.AAC.1